MTRTAAVTVRLSAQLREWSGEASDLEIPASTVRGLLEAMAQLHPAVYRGVCDETGAVRRHVNLFVNTTHLRDRGGLDAPLAPGDEVMILPAVSGG